MNSFGKIARLSSFLGGIMKKKLLTFLVIVFVFILCTNVYVDAAGKTHGHIVYQSGKDGSVLLTKEDF